MSIESPTGILDIRNATLKVSKLEVTNATGFDTALNNIARNTILLVDSTEQTASNSWALKLPNAWVGEFEGYWASGATGDIDFNFYNSTTSGTNGYTLTMDDTTIVVKYDGATLQTTTISSTLKTDAYRNVSILFERDTISVSIDGSRELYFKDSTLRSRVYDDEAGGYITVGGLDSTNRKFKNLKVVNEKWISDGTSNIAYMGGNVGIGTTAPQKTLEVAGPLRITDGLSNVCDFSLGAGTGGWDTGTKLVATDPDQSDYFGWSVAISGDGNTTIVGARTEDGPPSAPSPNSGSAYIFTRTGSSWDTGTKIRAPDLEAGNQFGYSVSISNDGNTAIVSAHNQSGPPSEPPSIRDLCGAAYIFTRTDGSWDTGTKIRAPDPQIYDSFGFSVAISGDGNTAIVGAYVEDGTSPSYTFNSGAAYIFTRTSGSWDTGTKIVASDAQGGDYFGFRVAISDDGNTAIVGAENEDRPGQPTSDQAGAAYIFTRTNGSWDTGTKIVASDREYRDLFGYTVAISGDGNTAIVGAIDEDGTSPAPDFNSGAAYIFTRTDGSWDTGTKIRAPDPETQDYLGYSVSLSYDGNTAIVGSRYEDGPPSAPVESQGSVYIFTRTNGSWDTGTKITNPDPEQSDYFGGSVSISSDGNTIIAGAYTDDGTSPDVNFNSGAAYIFEAGTAATLTVSKPIVADGTLLSFTGQHICFPEGPMGQGLVVSANKNKYVSLNGSLTMGTRAIKSSEALPVVSLSNVASDRSVFGVVDRIEQGGTTRKQKSGVGVIKQDKESGDNRVVVNALGEGALWVASTNGNVVSGDFLTTSHLPGYAQRQSEDFRCNYTVAKSTMDCDFEPEDLPVQVILKDDDGNNVLDSYGRLQWVDSDRTEPAYRIRYLDVSGVPTDEANAVHRAAFVGCTYHCG